MLRTYTPYSICLFIQYFKPIRGAVLDGVMLQDWTGCWFAVVLVTAMDEWHQAGLDWTGLFGRRKLCWSLPSEERCWMASCSTELGWTVRLPSEERYWMAPCSAGLGWAVRSEKDVLVGHCNRRRDAEWRHARLDWAWLDCSVAIGGEMLNGAMLGGAGLGWAVR